MKEKPTMKRTKDVSKFLFGFVLLFLIFATGCQKELENALGSAIKECLDKNSGYVFVYDGRYYLARNEDKLFDNTQPKDTFGTFEKWLKFSRPISALKGELEWSNDKSGPWLIGVFSIGKVEDKYVDKIRKIVEGAGRQCLFILDEPLPLLWEE